MRDFNESDRTKKKERIKIKENPADLSTEQLAELENTVKGSLKEGYLSCPTAWKIASNAGVPKIAVGEITDRLGIRVTSCQLGCFGVEKTLYNNPEHKHLEGEIVAELEKLIAGDQLSCTKIFELARQ